MQVLLLHLSDAHIKSDADNVLQRVHKIAEAAKSRAWGVTHLLILFSGDIAFSGKSSEYALAKQFIAELVNGLGMASLTVVVPGNHDCDFENDLDARSLIIDGLSRLEQEAVKPSVESECTSIQKEFFKFRDEVAASHLSDNRPRIAYEYQIILGTETVIVRCFNTAWVSQLHETPGTLVYPNVYLPELPQCSLSISTFHHPYNWLTPQSMSRFRRAMEATSDIILTGHEHTSDRRASYKYETMKTSNYIEAGALQETRDKESSAFNIIIVDTEKSLQKFFHFKWSADHYEPLMEDEQWLPMPLNAHRLASSFEVEEGFREWLNDAGIPNKNGQGKQRAFNDIFLFPQLIESLRDPALGQKRRTIKSEAVFATINALPIVLISAPPKSGRTSLAKALFATFLRDNLVPVYIDASQERLRSSDAVLPSIFRQASSQYGKAHLENYRQLPRERRVIIIDNLDKSKGRTEELLAIIASLSAFAANVIVLGDDSLGRLSELAPVADVTGVAASFEIQPFNRGLRERLSQQWLRSSGKSESDETDSIWLERVSKTLDTIIGKNYVPAFPIYVIAVLQAFEDGSNVDMRASTHGYFYEILIRLALAGGGGNKVDFDVRLAFLTHFAYELFESGKPFVLLDEMNASFKRYQERYEVGGLDYALLLDALITRGMLVKEADRVLFRYPYLYYYFVANYLHRNISNEPARKHIERLSADLGNGHASDILLFLAHLSSDRFVIDQLLGSANAYYTSEVAASIEVGVAGLSDSELKIVYEEKSHTESRREAADAKDEQLAIAQEDFQEIKDDESQSEGQKFSTALEMLRILGQVLKNFPGSLEGETKLAIAQTCYSLGRRCLSVTFNHLNSEKHNLIATILAIFRESFPHIPERRLKPRVERYVWMLNILTSHGMIKSIATAVAAPELVPTYDRLLSSSPDLTTKLIDIALRLDISAVFPSYQILRLAEDCKGKPLPMTVLRLLVFEHLGKVAVDRQERQKVCDSLGIEYKMLSAVSLAP